MESIFKTIVILFFSIILIGIFMKVANHVGERIGIYKILQDLWGLLKRNK